MLIITSQIRILYCWSYQVRLRRDIQIENINGALDALVDFELIYKQDQGKLVSSLVVDTQYLLCINDQDIDLWSIDSELSFLQEADRNHLKKLMRHCDDRFHAWMREIKSYFNRLTVQPLHRRYADQNTQDRRLYSGAT